MRKTDEPRRSEGNHRLMTSWPVLTLTISHPDMFSTFKLFSASKTVKLPHALTRLLWVCVCVVRCGPASHQIPYHLTSFRSSAPHGHSSRPLSFFGPLLPQQGQWMKEILQLQYVSAGKMLFCFCFVLYMVLQQIQNMWNKDEAARWHVCTSVSNYCIHLLIYLSQAQSQISNNAGKQVI